MYQFLEVVLVFGANSANITAPKPILQQFQPTSAPPDRIPDIPLHPFLFLVLQLSSAHHHELQKKLQRIK